MSIRESRRHKERRSVIPFGDIMLPVIGLVAVGLLIVGVKLFFLSGDRNKPYTPLPIHQEEKSTPTPSVATPQIQPGHPEKEGASEAILAVPVAPGGNTGRGVKVETAAPPPAIKPKTPPRPPEIQSPAPPPSNSRWGVQIGSFSARRSAETVQQQAERAGFRATILTGKVRGKTYYRVTVPAGNTRAEAVSLSQRLTKSGFPVFVVSIR